MTTPWAPPPGPNAYGSKGPCAAGVGSVSACPLAARGTCDCRRRIARSIESELTGNVVASLALPMDGPPRWPSKPQRRRLVPVADTAAGWWAAPWWALVWLLSFGHDGWLPWEWDGPRDTGLRFEPLLVMPPGSSYVTMAGDLNVTASRSCCLGYGPCPSCNRGTR